VECPAERMLYAQNIEKDSMGGAGAIQNP
jgi:hypothetical protein